MKRSVSGLPEVVDRAALAQALKKDPRFYDKFDITNLKHKDYVVVVDSSPGALCFLREDELIMAFFLPAPTFQRAEKILLRLMREHFRVKRSAIKDEEGVPVSFWVLLSQE